jgi:hypothetical protein
MKYLAIMGFVGAAAYILTNIPGSANADGFGGDIINYFVPEAGTKLDNANRFTVIDGEAMELIHVQSLRSGVIKVDGNPVTLAGLSTALAQIKAKKGAVLYYREGPKQEPTEHQREVFEEILSARVPISMSSKPDFSDVIDAVGHSKPRRR